MNEKLRLMIKIARLYYESGMTQDAISQKLRLSRPRVSRLMQEAIESGVVKISIAQEPGGYTDLERILENKFGLIEVVVGDISNPDSPEQVSKDLGQVSADFFSRIVQDGDTVGLTWGATLASMVESIRPEKKSNVMVIQMVGGLGEPAAETHATGMVSRLAVSLGGTFCLMPAPGVVGTSEAAHLLRTDRYISQTLEKIKQIDIAFVGIGAPTRNSVLMRGESIITWPEMDRLVQAGAVGDISLHFYDIHGQQIETELNDRVIGASLDDIKGINRVVGVAGGLEKVDAIVGAIRGRCINTLITDQYTARKLLEFDL